MDSNNGWFQLEQKKQSEGSKASSGGTARAVSVSRQNNMVRIPIPEEEIEAVKEVMEPEKPIEKIISPQKTEMLSASEYPSSHWNEIKDDIPRKDKVIKVHTPPEEIREESFIAKEEGIKEQTVFPAVAAGRHKLPPLPYAYNALEPVIDAETLRIHHDKHHKKYVDDLNAAELAVAEARKNGDYRYAKYWEGELAFNGSGHILHSVYWAIMTRPDSGGSPGEYTKGYIDWYFGGFERFKAQFSEAAKKVEGSGWCVLGCSPSFYRLEILQCEKHENLTQWGIIPILVCDVWEHAYYLKYQNDRASYVDNWWRLVNWPEVERRLADASRGVLPIE